MRRKPLNLASGPGQHFRRGDILSVAISIEVIQAIVRSADISGRFLAPFGFASVRKSNNCLRIRQPPVFFRADWYFLPYRRDLFVWRRSRRQLLFVV
jgi:hypothetical protein